MSIKRKNSTSKRGKKKLPAEIMAIKAHLATKQNLFPEMTKRVQEMLDKSDWRPC